MDVSNTYEITDTDDVEDKDLDISNEEYEKILLNIEPMNPFFMVNKTKSLLDEKGDNLNVMVFKDKDLKILHEIFPLWKGKYFKIKEFIRSCNDINNKKSNVESSATSTSTTIIPNTTSDIKTVEGNNTSNTVAITNNQNEMMKPKKLDPEMDLLHDPLNTTLPWELNCYRWPGVNYKSHVELYWAMITIETLPKYPKIEFTFFDENKYINDMRFDWERKISLWQQDLKKLTITQFPLWCLKVEKELDERNLLYCLKKNINNLDPTKVTPLHKAENKFIFDYVVKGLFPNGPYLDSAPETWLQLKKSFFKNTNPMEVANSILKSFPFNTQTRTYHMRHWIEKANSFPQCLNLPLYPDKVFINELFLKCKIYYAMNDTELSEKVKVSKSMPLNEIIYKIDKYNCPQNSTESGLTPILTTGTVTSQALTLESSTSLTPTYGKENSNNLESRIDMSNAYRVNKPKHTIGSNVITSHGNVYTLGNSTLSTRKSILSSSSLSFQGRKGARSRHGGGGSGYSNYNNNNNKDSSSPSPHYYI